jgi:hypothetical protein
MRHGEKAVYAGVQAYEDYRNHPRFMKQMTAFFKALLGVDIEFVFPRRWFTKGETLKEYMALSNSKDDEWWKARSCWQDSRNDLERLSVALLRNEVPFPKPVRLLGISLSSLQGEEQQEPQLGLPI